jgi:hypothetical protein
MHADDCVGFTNGNHCGSMFSDANRRPTPQIIVIIAGDREGRCYDTKIL